MIAVLVDHTLMLVVRRPGPQGSGYQVTRSFVLLACDERILPRQPP